LLARVGEDDRLLGSLHAAIDRLASLAVRTGERTPLAQAVLALLIDGERTDPRDVLMKAAVVLDASRRVQASLEQLLADAEAVLGGSRGDWFRTFLARQEKDKNLEVMGYRAGEDEDGFRYVHRYGFEEPPQRET